MNKLLPIIPILIFFTLTGNPLQKNGLTEKDRSTTVNEYTSLIHENLIVSSFESIKAPKAHSYERENALPIKKCEKPLERQKLEKLLQASL